MAMDQAGAPAAPGTGEGAAAAESPAAGSPAAGSPIAGSPAASAEAGGPGAAAQPKKRVVAPMGPRVPRGWLIAGMLLAFGAPLVYGVQFNLGWLVVPWYVPVVGTLGAVCLLIACVKRPGMVRGLLLALALGLAAVEWAYLLRLGAMPAYAGPLAIDAEFPEFDALRSDGTRYTRKNMTNMLDKGYTLVVFFRGRWCPYCMKELKALNDRREEFDARNIQLVAVSVDGPEDTRLTQQDLPWIAVLSDPGGKLATAVGVMARKQALDKNDAAVPTLFLIDRAGKVIWMNRPSHAMTRPSPDEVLQVFDHLRPQVW